MPIRRVKVPYQGKVVDGEELDFETINEGWNEYACIDGSRVRVKLVIAKITRLLGEKNDAGEPVYALQMQTIVSATPPAGAE